MSPASAAATPADLVRLAWVTMSAPLGSDSAPSASMSVSWQVHELAGGRFQDLPRNLNSPTTGRRRKHLVRLKGDDAGVLCSGAVRLLSRHTCRTLRQAPDAAAFLQP